MRLIIVANRFPVTTSVHENKVRLHRGSGGMALGLASYLEHIKKTSPVSEYLWIGWPGASIPEEKQKEVKEKLNAHKYVPIFLSQQQVENFYNGFANDTLWPLFHWLPGLVKYRQDEWNAYKEVNELYARAVIQQYRVGDVIWIHDYQLMLVPKILREKLGDQATIGFFLHIPFPSYEIFRLLPDKWRRALLQGILAPT